MLTEQFIKDEFYKAFNYFNGKINTISIAAGLNFVRSTIPIKAFTDNVTIAVNMLEVLNDTVNLTEDQFKQYAYAIKIITHELAHLDQIYDIGKYHTDENYRTQIEHQANYLSSTYILENIDDIKANLGDFTLEGITYIQHVASSNLSTIYNKLELVNFYETRLKQRCENLKVVNFDNYDSVFVKVIDSVNYLPICVKLNGGYAENTYFFNKYVLGNLDASLGTGKITASEVMLDNKKVLAIDVILDTIRIKDDIEPYMKAV